MWLEHVALERILQVDINNMKIFYINNESINFFDRFYNDEININNFDFNNEINQELRSIFKNYFLGKNKKQKYKMKILLIQIWQMHKLRLVIHAI